MTPRKIVVLSIFLIGCIVEVFGQKIDSLRNVLRNVSGVERCDVLYQLAYELIDVDNDDAVFYSKEAFESAKKSGDTLRIVRAGRIRSLALRRTNKMDSALNLSMEILSIARQKNYVDEIKHLLNGMGLAFMHQSNYDEALKANFESLELRRKNGSKEEVSVSLNNIGLIYFKLEDFDKALTYYLQALEVKTEANDDHELELVLINISLCYAYKEEFDKAMDFSNKAFELCNNNCSSWVSTQRYFCLGLIHFGLKSYLKAEEYFNKSYVLSKQDNNERFQIDNISYLADIQLKTNNTKAFEKYVKQSEAILSSGASYNYGVIRLYSNLISLYGKKGDNAKVALYCKKYIELKDSVYNIKLTTNLMRIEADYIGKISEAKIRAQNEVLILNNRIISRQRFITLCGGIIVLLLVILFMKQLRLNRIRKQVNSMLEQQVKERTVELETNANVMRRSLQEQELTTKKQSSDLKQGLASINGLCALGLKDEDRSATEEYLRKIEETSEQLLKVIKRNSKDE